MNSKDSEIPVDFPDRWVALCLHDVWPLASTGGGGPERFATTRQAFETLLDTIQDAGFYACSMDEAVRRVGQARVAITFDDATLSQFTFAMPALRNRGMTATVYAVTDWVGRPGFMTWDDLRRIRDWGMSVQSHTKTHPFLSELDAAALQVELDGSKEVLDSKLGQETVEIAFPGGDAPRGTFRPLIRRAGYSRAVGSRWGINRCAPTATRFALRCTVRSSVTAEWAIRVARGDRILSAEAAVREGFLRNLRALLGPSRYAHYRRRALDMLTGS